MTAKPNETIVTTDFRCDDCGDVTEVHHPDGRIPGPPHCQSCGSPNTCAEV